jgi:hypothetical protein
MAAACDQPATANDAGGDPAPPSKPAPHADGSPRETGSGFPDAGATSADVAAHPNPADAGADPDVDGGEPSAASCPAGTCDLLDPLTCPEPEGCVLARVEPGAVAEPQCVAAGTGADGDPCERSADCSPGLDCTRFDGAGTCRRYCCELSRTEGCPAGQFCRVALELEMTASGAALCDRCDDCELGAADACGPERGCYPLSGAHVCSACLPAGALDLGAPCALSTDCRPGSACFRVGPLSRCTAFCAFGDDEACSGDAACKQVAGVQLPDGVGLCL